MFEPNSDNNLLRQILKRISKADAGKYYCSASNQYGMMTRTVELKVNDAIQSKNSSSCCSEQGVSPACLSACAYDVDIMFALKKPECIQDLDKLMHCAADGSDHRLCCKTKGVPWSCQKWCAGRPVQVPTHCALISAREIVSCFEEGKGILPGPPPNVKGSRVSNRNSDDMRRRLKQNGWRRGMGGSYAKDEVRSRSIDRSFDVNNSFECFQLNGEILVTWDKPTKHPEVVQWYKIFWRVVGSMDANKNETDKLEFRFPADNDKIYEILVKVGTRPEVERMSTCDSPARKIKQSLRGNGLRV